MSACACSVVYFEERWQESLNARNTQAANQAVYAAWSAIWTAEATEDIINIYKYFTSRGQRCPYTFQSVEAFSRWTTKNSADVAIYDGPLEEAFFALISPYDWSEEHYEAFFFEELPDGEKIHNHLCHIQDIRHIQKVIMVVIIQRIVNQLLIFLPNVRIE